MSDNSYDLEDLMEFQELIPPDEAFTRKMNQTCRDIRSFPEEEWRPTKYRDILISSYKRVKSLKRWRGVGERILHQTEGPHGYYVVLNSYVATYASVDTMYRCAFGY